MSNYKEEKGEKCKECGMMMKKKVKKVVKKVVKKIVGKKK